MQVSVFGQLNGMKSPIDDTVENLATLRDEGFRRLWMSQMPYEPDLLTVLAVALREVDTIEVASGVVRSRISIRCRWRSAQRSPSAWSRTAGFSSASA